MRIAVMMCVALSFAGHAWAQPATPDTDLTKLGYVSAGDIAAGLKKLPQDRADISMRIFQIPPYNINAAHRAPVSQVANVHDDQSELFMVIEGTGSIVWGGTVAGATRNGANITGRGIDGGNDSKARPRGLLRGAAGIAAHVRQHCARRTAADADLLCRNRNEWLVVRMDSASAPNHQPPTTYGNASVSGCRSPNPLPSTKSRSCLRGKPP